jgi:hypothetical protein
MTEVRPHRRDAAREGRWREAFGAHGCEPAFEVLDGGLADRSAAGGGQGGQVATVRVDGARGALGRQQEQEALDVVVGGEGRHGARMDSVGRRPLLRRATLGALRWRAAVPAAAALAALWAMALPDAAQASQLIARNTSTERLAVGRDGRVLITYHARGRLHRVLAWGAVNAHSPSEARRQVGFALDYSGGWGRFRRPVWKTIRNVCGPYRGPALHWVVAACTAPDGSHWALQAWRRSQANFGLTRWKRGHGARELRLSHWTGPVAQLEAWTDWSYNGRWHHLFGRLTYRGLPVHGFSTTPSGEPLDAYGRVLYLDTLDSAYGPGWRRENGFVARLPDGTFCYGFVPHRAPSGELRPAGHGRRYRLICERAGSDARHRVGGPRAARVPSGRHR